MSDPNQQFHAPPAPAIQPEPERQRPGYLMWAGIALVIVGIVIVVLGIPGVALIVGGIGTGAAVCALGVLLFIFSFIRMPAVDNPPPRMSAMGTLTGTSTSRWTSWKTVRSNRHRKPWRSPGRKESSKQKRPLIRPEISLRGSL